MALDHETWHAASGEEHCQGQPVQAATGDQNGRAGLHATILRICLVLSSISTRRQTRWFAAPHGLEGEHEHVSH